MKNLLLLAVVMLSLPFLVAGQTAKNDSLQKSLKNLKNDLLRYAYYKDPSNQTVTYNVTPINFKECTVTYGYLILTGHDSSGPAFRNNRAVNDAIQNNIFLSPKYRSVVSFDFAELDPQSVKVVQTGKTAKLLFQTIAGKSAIREKNPRTTEQLQETSIPIRNPKFADEIQKEFINVIRGCQAGI